MNNVERPARIRQRGFSLIEALIALVVLSIGLLGIAALQTQSLLQSRNAFLTSQATSLAQDMADRIRANPQGSYNLAEGADAPSGDSLAANDMRGWLADIATTLPESSAEILISNRRIDITLEWQEAGEAEPRTLQMVTER